MVSVTVLLMPLIVVEERAAVTPAGNVPRVRVTGALKPFCATTRTLLLNTAPGVSESEETSVFSVNPGIPKTTNNKLAL